MTLIICIDDKGGMLFNKRRQSRDSAVIDDILRHFSPVSITAFSEKLFEGKDGVLLVDDPISVCGTVFLENIDPTPYRDKFQRIVVYKWNRVYPGDMKIGEALFEGFKRRSVSEFKGSSHDKITREIYEK